MPGKKISQLPAASELSPTDLLPIEQDGVGKKVSGQVLESWLLSFANVHGGVVSYGIKSTSGLVDTYEIVFADGSTFEYTVTNGAKGNTGDAATLKSKSVAYQVGTSGTSTPTGTWQTSVPSVANGKYLWTRVTLEFNSGDPVTFYSVARFGIDGSGAVSTVCGKSPNSSGNVSIGASDVGALPLSGGTVTGGINMNSQKLTGINKPTSADSAANKGYVDTALQTACPVNLLDNSNFVNPVNQRGETSISKSGYFIDRWYLQSSDASQLRASITADGLKCDYSSVVRQIVPKEKCPGLLDGDYTVVFGKSDGSCTIKNSGMWTTDNGDYVFPMNSGTWAWAALYAGKYTSDNLPSYRPNVYAVELLECLRYYYRIKTWWKYIGSGFIQSDVKAHIVVNLPMPMRTSPTVSTSGAPNLRIVSDGNTEYTPTAMEWATANDATSIFDCAATISGGKMGAPAMLFLGEADCIEFSSDL